MFRKKRPNLTPYQQALKALRAYALVSEKGEDKKGLVSQLKIKKNTRHFRNQVKALLQRLEDLKGNDAEKVTYIFAELSTIKNTGLLEFQIDKKYEERFQNKSTSSEFKTNEEEEEIESSDTYQNEEPEKEWVMVPMEQDLPSKPKVNPKGGFMDLMEEIKQIMIANNWSIPQERIISDQKKHDELSAERYASATIEKADENENLFPPEILELIGTFADKKTLINLSLASQGTHHLFSKLRTKQADPHTLLMHVMDANPESAQAFLTAVHAVKPENRLVTTRTFAKEQCGRKWEAVSSLEYAAWAGDTHMVELLLSNCVEGELPVALAQLRNIQIEGTEHGAHLASVRTLINRYETKGFKMERPNNKSWEKWPRDDRDKYWVKEIGTAQARAPLNILQWYCSPKPLNGSSSFKGTPPRTFLLKPVKSFQSLSDIFAGLGRTFAIDKGHHAHANYQRCFAEPRYSWGDSVVNVNTEIAALKHFCEVRKKDLDAQILKLEDHLSEDQHRKTRPL